jgi:glycosyltransferase involved in cell wall biosynthesis
MIIKKRIGIECHNLEGARFGVGQTLIQLLEALSELPNIAERFEFYLYFKKEIPADKVLESPIFIKKILRAPHLPPSFSIFYHFLIPINYIKDNLDGFFFPGYMLPIFFIGKSAVIMTNDVFYEIHRGTLPFKYRIAYQIFSWWAIKKADKIITISDTAKKEISENYHLTDDKIAVVPWGINKELSQVSFSDNELDDIKKKFSVEKHLVFSWGQAFPRRHIKEAMLSFANIAKQYNDIQYLAACADKYNPPMLAELAKKINTELGREAIIYRSYIEDQRDLFGLIKAARLVVYVSTSEAMGLPPIEALSLKTPSLVADTALTREIFGNNAFFVKDPDNIDETTVMMKDGILNEDKRNEIIENSSVVTKKFTWPVSSKSFLEIFDKIF